MEEGRTILNNSFRRSEKDMENRRREDERERVNERRYSYLSFYLVGDNIN